MIAITNTAKFCLVLSLLCLQLIPVSIYTMTRVSEFSSLYMFQKLHHFNSEVWHGCNCPNSCVHECLNNMSTTVCCHGNRFVPSHFGRDPAKPRKSTRIKYMHKLPIPVLSPSTGLPTYKLVVFVLESNLSGRPASELWVHGPELREWTLACAKDESQQVTSQTIHRGL